MRAREYIEANKLSIQHIDDVKRVISELLPLRTNKGATDDYFNRILSADIRRQNYLMQKDFFERNNAMQQQEPAVESYENEIPYERAFEVRESLFQVIKQDKSFGYLYFLLGTEQNSKHKSEPIDCIPNPETINEAIQQHRDDYPKKSLSEYLNDDFNYSKYAKISEKNDFNEIALLDFFNKTYRIYDEIRIGKENPLSVAEYFNSDKSHETELLKFYTYSFIDSLISEYAQDDKQLMRIQKELRKVIKPLSETYNTIHEIGNNNINIALNNTRGYRVNFIRIINNLYELNFFKDKDQNSITKKEVFELFGKTLNMDLSTYQNDLSVSKSTANKDMKSSLKIFEDMIEKQKDINEK